MRSTYQRGAEILACLTCLAISSLALTGEPKATKAPATLEPLIEIVSHAAARLTYDAKCINQPVARFDQKYLRKYKVDSKNMIGAPERFTNAKFEYRHLYFALLVTQVTTN
jgi:hypothetical protein